MKRGAVVGVVLSTLVACGGAEVMPGLFFPTWEADGDVPAGIVQGTLVFENDCLMLEAHGVRTFVVWEEGAGFRDWSVLDRRGEPIAQVGEQIHGGGGYFSDRAHVESLAGRPIPERCVPDSGEPFALIYDVAAGPSG